MSSNQDPYYYPEPNPIYYESDSEPSIAEQLSYLEQTRPPIATLDDQRSFPQPQPTLGLVENPLELHDPENMSHAFGYAPDNFVSDTSLPHPSVGTDATYNNDFHYSSASLPSYDPSNYEYGEPLHQFAFTPQEPVCNYVEQSFPHGTYGMAPFSTDVYPYSQLSPLDCGGPMDRIDSRTARPTSDSMRRLDGVSTGMELPNVDTELYSHLAPVASAPANQISAAGPSRLIPSSPERKRLLPLSAAEELSTARRVVPRLDRAQSVHSTSSDTHRRPSHSYSDIAGRGPLIPQERYTTSSISSYNAPENRPHITFNLDTPEQIGIPITDILEKTDAFGRLQNGAETFDMGKKTFTLRIQWPGYKPWSKTIAAMDWRKSRGPITRAKLAEATATAIRDVLGKYRNQPCDPDYAQWSVGPNGIQLQQICLVELHHVSKGSWQPKLCLLEPRH